MRAGYRFGYTVRRFLAGSSFAPSETTAVLDDVLRELALRCNKYMNTVEDYYLHGLWQARDIVLALKNAAPQADLKGSEAPLKPLAGPEVSSHRPDAKPAVAAPPVCPVTQRSCTDSCEPEKGDDCAISGDTILRAAPSSIEPSDEVLTRMIVAWFDTTNPITPEKDPDFYERMRAAYREARAPSSTEHGITYSEYASYARLVNGVLDEVEALRRGLAVTHVGPDPVGELRWRTPTNASLDRSEKLGAPIASPSSAKKEIKDA